MFEDLDRTALSVIHTAVSTALMDPSKLGDALMVTIGQLKAMREFHPDLTTSLGDRVWSDD